MTEPPQRLTLRDRLFAGLVALLLAILLERIRGHADWGPSEGVYAVTSRLVLHGGDLYGDLVASQPPWVYLFGTIGLAVHDSLDALRLACGLLQVLTALLAAEAVMRLTASRAAAIAASALVVITPWATHQHGLLLPEQLGAPLLLGAALLAARPGTVRWAGVLAGVAIFAKLPFVVPAALVVAASPGRGTAVRWALLTIVVQAVAFTAVFGFDLWRSIVQAQAQAGGGLELQVGPWVQAGWNEFPLIVGAAAALLWRRHARDHVLLVTVTAAAAGALLSTITMVKPGTGLNVIVPSEPLLATLAVTGVVLALRADVGRRAVLAGAVVVLGGLLLAQSISLLADPENPRPFHRPLSSSPGWKVLSTRDEVDRMVRSAKRCPPGTVYAGPPLVAFLAHRRVPGGQPDYFIVSRAELHAETFARVRADGPRCQ